MRDNCHTLVVLTNSQMITLIFMTIVVVTTTHLMCHGYSIHSQAKGLMTNNNNPMKTTTNLFGLSRTSRIQQRTTPIKSFGLYSQPYYSTSTTTISPGATKTTTTNDDNDDDDEESEYDNSNNDLYQQIGIERKQLALGVKPEEVLKYIGTREDLISKTLKDIESFDRNKAINEVDKFFLDAEMINLLIQFGKEVEKDPDFKVPEQDEEKDGFFSFRTLVVAYLGYVAYDSFPRIFRSYVYDQQELGTWTGTNIQFIDEWIETTTPLMKAARAGKETVTDVAAASTVIESTITDTVNTISDTVNTISDTVNTISDTVTTTISSLDGSVTSMFNPMNHMIQNDQSSMVIDSVTNLLAHAIMPNIIDLITLNL